MWRVIACAALLILAAASSAPAQNEPKPVTVAVIGETPGPIYAGLREGLARLGYYEGANLRLEARFVHGHLEQYPAFVAELLALHPDVIVTVGSAGSVTARDATHDTPIVFTLVGNPIGGGLVTRLAHPGGNITGFSILAGDLEAKRLELLKEIVPDLGRVTLLSSPGASIVNIADLQTSAAKLGIAVETVDVTGAAETDYQAILASKPQAVIGVGTLSLFTQTPRLAAFLLEHRIASTAVDPGAVTAGVLLSYAADYSGQGRDAAVYVDKILHGTPPGDLPVQQPTVFRLVINLTTAKALGITVPPTLLQRADEVIE